jgi:hypothetical protein
MPDLDPVFRGTVSVNTVATAKTNVKLSGSDGTISFNGPLLQGTGSFGVSQQGAVTSTSLASGTGAFGTSLTVGTTLADSCLVASGPRVTANPQVGVHLGQAGSVMGITVGTLQQGASLYGGELIFAIMNQPSARAKLFYSMASDVMQFWTTAPSATAGSISALLNSTGLLVGTTSATPAESCIVAGGAVPSTVNVNGVHLGSLPSGSAALRLISPSQAQTPPAVIDFQTPGSAALTRGALIYNFNGATDDIVQICTDYGYPAISLCQTGCLIGPNVALANGSVPESSLIVSGVRPTTNPATAGVHAGLVSSLNAQVVLAATAKTGYSYLDWAYAGQAAASTPTLRIQANHTLQRAQFLMGATGTVESFRLTPTANTSFVNMSIGPSGTAPSAALHITGSANSTLTQGVCAYMDPIAPNIACLALVAGNNSSSSQLDFKYSGQNTTGTNSAAIKGRISLNHNLGTMNFYNQQGQFMCVDGGATSQVMINATTVVGTNKLYVNGGSQVNGLLTVTNGTSQAVAVTGSLQVTNSASQAVSILAGSAQALGCTGYVTISNPAAQGLTVYGFTVLDASASSNTALSVKGGGSGTALSVQGGNFTCSGTKNFDVPHPSKPGWRLRHRCVESDVSRLHYEFTLECQEGLNSQALPDWHGALNSHCRVYCSPVGHFGRAWGQVVNGELQLTAESPGQFNVLLTGTRSDPAAISELAEYGVEYADPDIQ